MTLVVLALDGLDGKLVNRFNADAYRIGTRGDVETYAHDHDGPYTLEVWPTVATGLHATDHGVTGTNTSEWDNPLVEFASKFAGMLSGPMRARIGHIIRDTTGASYAIPETEAETMFDGRGRVVHNWPGVENSEELRDVWRMTNQDYSQAAFEREVYGKAAAQFGWTKEMLNHNVSLIGVHIHALDVFGHSYHDDEGALQAAYDRVGEFVQDLRDEMTDDDELLLISDHGIKTTFTDPAEEASEHSWRAYASSTLDTVPDSVFSVREWVESVVEEVDVDDEALEMPKEQLRQLGYIE